MTNRLWRLRHPELFGTVLASSILACSLGGTGGSTAGEALEAQQTQPGPPPTSPPTMVVDCDNVYLPVVEDATWRHAGSTPSGPYVELVTIWGVGPDSFKMETSHVDVVWVDLWSCTAEGLVQLMSNGGQWSQVLAGPDGTVEIETLSQSGVTVPLSFKAGDSWSQEAVFSFTTDELSGTVRLVYEFHAVSPEDVTVPAGTFPAMRIDVGARLEDVAGQFPTTYYEGSQWLSPEIGRVRQSGETHVGDAAPGTGFLTTTELESYEIP